MAFPAFVIFVSFVVRYRQNKSPFAIALGDWFPLRTYFLISKASPNDSKIVIIVIIVVGEAQMVLHIGGIIAQTVYLARSLFALKQDKALETISGVLHANWWIAMVVYALSGVAYAYLVFLKPNRLARAEFSQSSARKCSAKAGVFIVSSLQYCQVTRLG